MGRSDKSGAIWLRAEAGHAIVCIEHKGQWIEVCREPLDAPFSHITEPAGIEARIKQQTADESRSLNETAREHFSGRNYPV